MSKKMNLIDAINNEKGNPFYIPDCTREELPELFKELGFKVGAEIGVSLGINMESYCKAGLTMYGIDPYVNYEDETYRPINMLSRIGIKTTTFDDVLKIAKERLDKYPNHTFIRKMSMDALANIPDRSLDFIYIDGNHSYGYVAMDLMKWVRKIKKGGILAGHDYYDRKGSRQQRFVGPAVDGFMKSYDVANWYILGRKHPEEGELHERVLSFMFIKHW